MSAAAGAPVSKSLLVNLLLDGDRPESDIIKQLAEFISSGLITRTDVNALNPRTGDTPLCLAVKNNYVIIAKYLLENGADPNAAAGRPLYYAYSGGNIHLTELLLKAGANVNEQYEYGGTLLHKAVVEDASDFIDLFLAAGADVDIRNRTLDQDTPYNIAERKEATALYKKLRAYSKFKFDKAYLLQGHGTESPVKFEERAKVPPGVVIVHQTTCGMPVYTSDTCNKILAFMNTNNHVLDPVRYKADIEAAFGTGLRIYTAGMHMPSLSVTFLNTHLIQVNDMENVYTIIKSGVYKYPISFDAIKMSDISGDILDVGNCSITGKIHNLILPITDTIATQRKILKAAYRGSIFPGETAVNEIPASAIRQIVLGEDDSTSLSRLYTIGEIIDMLGGGVYYLNTCRSIMGEMPASFNIGAVEAASQEQHERAERRGYLTNSAWALERRRTAAKKSRMETIRSHLRGNKSQRRMVNKRQEKRRTFKAKRLANKN